ncbi:MAG: CbtA family protein [Rhizobiaceae bacterium]
MLIRILLAAIFAGVIAGAFASAAQSYRVIPLILQAETYETGGHSHGSEGHSHADAGHAHGDGGAEAAEEAEAWGPADGFERTFFTVLSNLIAGVAFSMILTAGILFAREKISFKSGLVWGVCGFAVFVLAPNLGLPPELPGMVAGDLQARQFWWVATVICTAGGLWLFAFKSGIGWMAAGLVLIVAPHVYGAPHPDTIESAVPANLAAEFATATMVTSALFWLVLGGSLGWLLAREARQQSEAEHA